MIMVGLHEAPGKEETHARYPRGKKIFKACHRFLTHDYPKTPRQVLSELAETTDPELEADRYRQGDVCLS